MRGLNGYADAVVQKLKEHGYQFLRHGKGSHDIYTNGQRNQIVSRNMPARAMANTIMKQAGIDHKF